MPISITLDTQRIQNIVNAASVITDKPAFRITKEGLELFAVGVDKIDMIDIKCPAESFGSGNFNVDVEELMFAVNAEDAKKILKRFDPKAKKGAPPSMVTLSIADKVGFKSDSKSFTTQIFGAEKYERKTPNLGESATIQVALSDLLDAIADIQLRSVYAAFKIQDKKLKLETAGDKGTVESTVLGITDNGKVAESSFVLERLGKILSEIGGEHTVTLEFGNSTPVRVSAGPVTYILAPRK
jgi:DNA polymerase III sliding clamp (beta) subunit (PCNA family)